MPRILLIGSTGNVGSKVLAELLRMNMQVRVMLRNPAETGFSSLVETVRGDLTRPETLDACVDGIDSVLLIWTAPSNTIHSAIERIALKVRRIVFLSAPLRTAHPFFQQPNPLRTLHEQIEREIESSGVEWTFLRSGVFAGNARQWWAPQIRAGNLVRWPYLNAPTAPVDERDVAAVAVLALCGNGTVGSECVLTGSQSLTQLEQVLTISQAIGRSLRIEEISPEDARRELHLPSFLLDAWAAALGQPAFVSGGIAEVTGKPARTFREWASDHAAEFRF